ncbi:MAG: hypothetical protein SFY68_07595 [Candidatus Sumerlaeia bacterium]|nr:hypothetical protein [Candidatus Sumerlaeia bacterium]
MPMCVAGSEIPGQNLTPLKLLVEDSWGELWRARHGVFGSVLFAAYTTTEGMRLFNQALPVLQRMLEGGGVATPLLLGVKAILPDEAVPYILLEDPQGKSFAEFAGDPSKVIDYEKIVEWGTTMMDQLIHVLNMNATPLGITAGTVFYDAAMKDSCPWRVAPILPGVATFGKVMAKGRYAPPELLVSSHPQFLNADCYAIAWMMSEAMLRDFEIEHDPGLAADRLGAPKLAAALMVGLQSSGGVFPDGASLATNFRRWVRNDAAGELKKIRKAQEKEKKAIEAAIKKGLPLPGAPAAAKSSPKAAAKKPAGTGVSTKHPGVIVGVERKGPGMAGLFASLAKIGALFGFLALLYFGFNFLFFAKASNKTAMGTARLFLDTAIVERDATKAGTYTLNPGDAQGFLNMIKSMESSNASAKIIGYQGLIADKQAGDKFLAQAILMSETENNVMGVFFEIEGKGDGTYVITDLDWKGLGAGTLGF